MIVKKVETDEEKELIYHIRKTVFVDEQNVPVEEEIDAYEEEAIHFICYAEHKAVGAGRLRFIDNYGKLERICVLHAFRGQSLGQLIIAKMEEEIKNNGYKLAKLNAQTHAKQFYERLGYDVISGEFIDAGIPHVTMSKQLS